MIKSGYKPEVKQEPVSRVNIEPGTRKGTFKLIVDDKTKDNIPIRGLGTISNVTPEQSTPSIDTGRYLLFSDVSLTGNGDNGDLELSEGTENGHLVLKIKNTPTTVSVKGLGSLAFLSQLNTTLWGQTFNGTSSVDGNLSNVGNISFKTQTQKVGNLLHFYYNNTGIGQFAAKETPNAALHVKGLALINEINITARTSGASAPLSFSDKNQDNLEQFASSTSGFGLTSWYSGGVWKPFYVKRADGYVGIRTDNPSHPVDINGDVYSNGSMTATSFIQSSDERIKNIDGDINLTIEQIAEAPSILFHFKDKRDKLQHGGTIAQYWEKIAPWAVRKDSKGELSLDYVALCIAAIICCARAIVRLEKILSKILKKLEDK